MLIVLVTSKQDTHQICWQKDKNEFGKHSVACKSDVPKIVSKINQKLTFSLYTFPHPSLGGATHYPRPRLELNKILPHAAKPVEKKQGGYLFMGANTNVCNYNNNMKSLING